MSLTLTVSFLQPHIIASKEKQNQCSNDSDNNNNNYKEVFFFRVAAKWNNSYDGVTL